MTPVPMADHNLRDPEAYAAPSLECDLIMKGGITSGLVYPLAACRLATRYRFRQVGGASAGAIAAALTAAAEYQRRNNLPTRPAAADQVAEADSTGFLALAGIPALMGQRLASLFQPSPALRAAYSLLTTAVEPGWSTGKKVRTALVTLARNELPAFLLTLVAVAGLLSLPFWFASNRGWVQWASLILALIVGKVAALVVAALRFGARTISVLNANGFGLCTGMTAPGSSAPALTPWLSDTLDRVAGLAPGEGPLTFGHLYGPSASATLADSESDTPVQLAGPGEQDPLIDLQMMTTCLTFQRPYAFPFRTEVFHYCPDCWADYFPPSVMDHLQGTSSEASEKTDRVGGVDVPIDQHCPTHRSTLVRKLPAAPDLPIVVGVRMSLSFPVLFSAVPLYTVDFNRGPGKRGLITVWFSDGGIASNFPIHFFDALWPSRPTFGINLAEVHPDFPDQLVWRPGGNRNGILPRAVGVSSLVGFLTAVVETMHNWVDNTAVPAPGFRDRVVELRTRDGEGGLNLKMPAEVISSLGERGDLAAQQLEEFDWDNHRWVRYRTSMVALNEVTDRMARNATTYLDFVANHQGPSYTFPSPDAKRADLNATTQFLDVAQKWNAAGHPATAGSIPDPRPQLRSAMRL